jgi:hypothetical protein
MFDESDIEEMQDQIEKLNNMVHDIQVKVGMKINKIKCLECSQIMESKYTHDFQMCTCDNSAFCDGGTEYQRVGAKDLNAIQIWKHEGRFESYGKK